MTDKTDVTKTTEQVQLRVAAEKESRAGREAARGEKPPEITSKFVLQCLESEQLGDGILYAALHKNRFVYAKNSQQWYVWNEHTWRRDDMDEAISAVEEVAIRYGQEIMLLEQNIEAAKKSDDEDEATWVKRRDGKKISLIRARISALRKDQGRNNCLKFAHTNPVNQLAITGGEFDLNPYLMGVQNGVVNLRTGELEKGYPSDFILKRCAVPYLGLNVDQRLPISTMRSIYDGDEEKIAFLQRLLGSALLGKVIDHVFPVFIGRGRNGKSLIIENLRYVMGDYAGIVPAEIMLDSNRPASHNQTDPVLMSLKGLRLAIASETGEGRKFSAERVKWLTGGDTLSARGLYDKHPTDFEPSHLLILITNHEPGAPAGDMAFWERCFLIKHPLSFVRRKPEKDYEREADVTLADRNRADGSAWLSWLVQGCIEWLDRGLDPPESVRQSTQEYREDEDYIGQFLETCTDIATGSRCGATELYEAFKIWYLKAVNDNKRFTPSQRAFGSKLKAREEFRCSKVHGLAYYHGLSLTREYLQFVLNAANQPPADLREDNYARD